MKFEAVMAAVRETVALPNLDPGTGGWRQDGRCDLNSRLAHALGLPGSGGSHDASAGLNELARQLGGNLLQLSLLLRDAGAGRARPWDRPPGRPSRETSGTRRWKTSRGPAGSRTWTWPDSTASSSGRPA